MGNEAVCQSGQKGLIRARRKSGAARLWGLAAVLLLGAAVLVGGRGASVRASGLMLPVAGSREAAALESALAQPNRTGKVGLNADDTGFGPLEYKTAIFYQKGTETLILSPTYTGNPKEFAWVIAVPSKPEVSILKGAPFNELKNFDPPSQPYYGSTPDRSGDERGVKVIERKTVGAYQTQTLTAAGVNGLENWLRRNNFAVSQRAHPILEAYTKAGWAFVVARIAEPQSAKGLSTGTLAPLCLRFTAPHPILPLRLYGAQAVTISLKLYLILPESNVKRLSKEQQEQLPSKMATNLSGRSPLDELLGSGPMMLQTGTLDAGQTQYQTLARLSRVPLCIYAADAYLFPKDCAGDIVWDKISP